MKQFNENWDGVSRKNANISEATPKAVKAANAMVAYEAAYDAFLKADNAEKNAKSRYLASKAASSAAYDHYRAAKAALAYSRMR